MNRAARMRLLGFMRKEMLQIVRDPSSIALALVMPVVLILLFGYGVSLDAEEVPIAIVLEDRGPAGRDLFRRFDGSQSFAPLHVASLPDAEALLLDHEVEAIVRLRSGFEAALASDTTAPVQLVLGGVDSNRARLLSGYVEGVVGTWAALRAVRAGGTAAPLVTLEPRVWFNPDSTSTSYLVPGLVALVMTLTGVLLTALVVAREHERGTLEAILASPLRPDEFLLAKIVPYYLLGMAGMGLTVGFGVALFDVPLRASVATLLALSTLFLLASLGLGLAISAVARTQFVAAQLSLIVGFLPTFFLSGLLFDLDSTPLPIRVISHVVPARWFVEASHTMFLAGDVPSVLLRDAAVLLVMAGFWIALARRRTPTRLDG